MRQAHCLRTAARGGLFAACGVAILVAGFGVFPLDAGAQPPVAITGISPSHGPASGGTTVLITGSDFTGATAVDFGSIPASSFTVTDDDDISAVSPQSEGGTVDITVAGPDGTSAATPADADTASTTAPGPPQDVQASASGPKTVQLTWQPPAFDGSSQVLNYRIVPSRQTALSTTAPATDCLGTPAICTATVSGFNTGPLTFSLSAVNQPGTSPSSSSNNVNVWAVAHVKLPSQPHLAVTTGEPVSIQLTASSTDGSALTFTLDHALPTGLSLDPASGLITGIVIVPDLLHSQTLGSWGLTATDAAGGSSRLVKFGGRITPSLKAPMPPFQRTTFETPAVPFQFVATDSVPGSTLTYSATNLPPGLAIDPSLGVISGTPTAKGPFRATITVTDNLGQSVSRFLSWAVTTH